MSRTLAGLLSGLILLLQPSAAGAGEAASPLRVENGVVANVRAALPLSGPESRALRPGDHFKECAVCPVMIVVPAGEFLMGSSEAEAGSTPDERPQHTVRIARPFAVGRFAVTFDEWDACVADGGCHKHVPSDRGWGRGRRPVIGLLWEDAKAYVMWLSRRTNRPYRLLSEAEREYVTRAGTTTPFWWGATITPAQANYDNGSAVTMSASLPDRHPVSFDHRAEPKTLPVDSFAPNPWGLHQVHGNVYDWVEDCANGNYHGAPADGSAWTEGDCSRHVLRGGAFSRHPNTLRAAARIWFGPNIRMHYMSMRVARTLSR